MKTAPVVNVHSFVTFCYLDVYTVQALKMDAPRSDILLARNQTGESCITQSTNEVC